MSDIVERVGATTFRGHPVTLLGPEIRVGDRAPDFTVLGNDMAPVTLSSVEASARVICSVPSLDTPVCDAQTRRFNEEVAGLGDVGVLTVSVDLPFAQARWCGAAGIEAVKTASDHRDLSLGLAYGVVVKELRLLARAVFVVDADGVVIHVEYVPAVEQQPNFDAVLEAASDVAGGTRLAS